MCNRTVAALPKLSACAGPRIHLLASWIIMEVITAFRFYLPQKRARNAIGNQLMLLISGIHTHTQM